MADTMLETYITGLKNAHGLETQAIQPLRRQVERPENYPGMSARIEQRMAEWVGQWIEQVVVEYAQREESGQTAGV